MKVSVKNSEQKARFLVVGGANTAIDFGLLFLLKALGLPVVAANIASTTAAFCFSFFANKKYTFKTKSTNLKKEIISFVLVTLFGLWVLQTIVIWLVSLLLVNWQLPSVTVLLIAKFFATCVSLTWNYVLYSRVVFKQED